MTDRNVELVRRGWDAAGRGDLDAVGRLLAPDVRWHGAGDDHSGCHTRAEALQFIREALAAGVRVELVEAREVGDGRVLALLQRIDDGQNDSAERRPPHGEIVTVRDGRIVEMVVYPTADEAIAAATV